MRLRLNRLRIERAEGVWPARCNDRSSHGLALSQRPDEPRLLLSLRVLTAGGCSATASVQRPLFISKVTLKLNPLLMITSNSVSCYIIIMALIMARHHAPCCLQQWLNYADWTQTSTESVSACQRGCLWVLQGTKTPSSGKFWNTILKRCWMLNLQPCKNFTKFTCMRWSDGYFLLSNALLHVQLIITQLHSYYFKAWWTCRTQLVHQSVFHCLQCWVLRKRDLHRSHLPLRHAELYQNNTDWELKGTYWLIWLLGSWRIGPNCQTGPLVLIHQETSCCEQRQTPCSPSRSASLHSPLLLLRW